jgi:hypothetical protein
MSYYKTTLPRLLNSLSTSGWDTQKHTYIVVGEADKASEDTVDGHDTPIYFCKYINVDNNGLIWASSPCGVNALKPYDWIFYLHDTCVVKPEFTKRLLAKIPSPDEYIGMKVCTSWSMSIGLYHVPSLHTQSMRTYLQHSINLTLDPVSMKSRVEDVVFDELRKYGNIGQLNKRYSDCKYVGSVYGEAHRRTEVFDWPGIHKYKANWGQGSWVIVP